MAEWIETLLSDILVDKGYIRGPFGSALKRGDMKEDGIPVYEQQHAIYNSRDFRYYIDKQKFNEMKRYQVRKDDLIISCSGTVGKVSIIKDDDPKGIISQALLLLRADTNKILPLYLKYFFSSRDGYNAIVSRSSGSVQVNIAKRSVIEQIPLKLPQIKIQRKIVGVLSSIDEKIEENKRINNNLLEQIKTICTAWLSEYKPFDGVMPSDWVETPLSDIAEFISGYSYKGTELTDSTIAMATIKNFDRKGGFKLDGYKEIIPSSKLKESQHAELFDTLVAHTDLTQNAEVIGNAEPVMSKSGYDDIVFSMDLVKVLPKKDGVSKYLITAILQDKKFKAHCLGYVNGTTVLHLSKKALPEYKLFLPSDFSTLKPLDEVVTALYKQVSSNISENTYLEELRESLLPKLMSGELDVSDIEI